jgi:hypothetical protein
LPKCVNDILFQCKYYRGSWSRSVRRRHNAETYWGNQFFYIAYIPVYGKKRSSSSLILPANRNCEVTTKNQALVVHQEERCGSAFNAAADEEDTEVIIFLSRNF